VGSYTMVTNRLSYSSINKFLQCPESYRLHYKERVRPIEIGSALLFGSAIGKAFECALNLFKLSPEPITHEDEIIQTDWSDAKECFDYYWSVQEINGKPEHIKTYPHVAYSRFDTDHDLLTKFHYAQANNDPNALAWYSMQQKAYLILDSFEKNLLPLIEHVYSTEELIELGNEIGDSSIGFADAVVKLKGYDKPIIIDFKTAAREYEPDSVQKSVQLSQYMHVLGDKYDTRLAGYAVFLKNIEKNRVKKCTKCGFDGSATKHKTCNNEIAGKRCNGQWNETISPECKMQLIIDTLPVETENFIISNIEDVNNAIKSNIYFKNVNSCYDNGFGRACEFVHLCRGNDMSQYVKLEDKK